MTEMTCFFCGKPLGETERTGFRDACTYCGRDLHVCLACGFHDPSVYNECREPQADRVIDKDRANFCEYFIPVPPKERSPSGMGDKGRDPRSRLEDLFKK